MAARQALPISPTYYYYHALYYTLRNVFQGPTRETFTIQAHEKKKRRREREKNTGSSGAPKCYVIRLFGGLDFSLSLSVSFKKKEAKIIFLFEPTT